MKKLLLSSVLVLLFGSFVRAGEYTAGVSLGSPTGITGKWWFTKQKALYATLDPFLFHIFQLSHIWRWKEFPPALKEYEKSFDYIFAGVGGSVKTQTSDRVGVRFPLGVMKDIKWWKLPPLRISGEVAPILRLSPSFGINVEGCIIIEYRF